MSASLLGLVLTSSKFVAINFYMDPSLSLRISSLVHGYENASTAKTVPQWGLHLKDGFLPDNRENNITSIRGNVMIEAWRNLDNFRIKGMKSGNKDSKEWFGSKFQGLL